MTNKRYNSKFIHLRMESVSHGALDCGSELVARLDIVVMVMHMAIQLASTRVSK